MNNNYGTNAQQDYIERKEKERRDQLGHETNKEEARLESLSSFERNVEGFQRDSQLKAEGKSIQELNAISEGMFENVIEEKNIEHGDIKQRDLMKEQATQGNSQAEQWLDADARAQLASQNEKNINAEIDRRLSPEYRQEVEEKLLQARQSFIEHVEQGAPSAIFKSQHKEWLNQYNKLDAQQDKAQEAFDVRVAKSSPQELEGLQQRAEYRHSEAQQATAERQGIAQLPSEKQGRVNVEEHLNQVKQELSPSQIEQGREQVVAKSNVQANEQTERKTKVQSQ